MVNNSEEQPRSERHGTSASSFDEFAKLELVGERVCLDFINTVDPRDEQYTGGQQKDYLTSYLNLVRWSQHAQLLSQEQAALHLQTAERHPDAAEALFERALALRDTLYRVFSAVAARQEPAAADLATVQATYVETLAHAHLAATTEGFQWQWPTEGNRLDQVLWPVVSSAMELLTAPEVLRRVKVCPGLGDCGWLFLDTSKSGRRRWCSMESCGSRAKMRHYYARTHAKSAMVAAQSPD